MFLPRIISGNSHMELARNVARIMKTSLIDAEIQYFKNGEIRPIIRESDIIIIQSGCGNIVDGKEKSLNDTIMEVIILSKTLKSAGSGIITLVMPNYPYARQDKKDNPRGCISARYVADILQNAGVDRIVCMDLHSSQIQGFFQIPCDNLYAVNLIRDYLWKNVFSKEEDYTQKYVVVAPDEGALKRAKDYSLRFGLKVVAVSKERDDSKKNEVKSAHLIGDPNLIQGRTAIIVDDMCDTFGTIQTVSKILTNAGAKDIIVAVTHGILSDPAMERLNATDEVKMMLVSDSIPQEKKAAQSDKLKVFSIAPLISEVISRISNNQSVSEIFKMEKVGKSLSESMNSLSSIDEAI
jgi:ribose-phosphate pyrophosphokinase